MERSENPGLGWPVNGTPDCAPVALHPGYAYYRKSLHRSGDQMETDEPTSHLTSRMIFEASILKEYQRDWPTDAGPKAEKPDELHTRRAMFQRLLESDDEFYILYYSATISATWLSILAVALIEELPAQTIRAAHSMNKVPRWPFSLD
jgi:hypothetical protein